MLTHAWLGRAGFMRRGALAAVLACGAAPVLADAQTMAARERDESASTVPSSSPVAAAPLSAAPVVNKPQFERDEDAPLAGYTNGAPFLRSRDSNFVLFPNGRLNVDGYFFPNRGEPRDNTTVDGTTDQRPRSTIFVRRARAELNGTILKRFDYMIAGEFASIPILFQSAAVTDAWVNANIHPWLNITVGQFDAPFTMENRTVDKYIDFMERSLTVRGFGIPSNKEIGIMLSGLAPSRFLRYELGVFNGDGLNVRNPDNHFDFMARGYFAPLALLPRAGGSRWLSEIWIGGSMWYGKRVDVPYDAWPVGTQGGVSILPPVFNTNNTSYRFVPNGDLLKWAMEVNVPIGPLGFRFELVRNAYEGVGIYRPPIIDSEKSLPLSRVLAGNVTRSGTSFYLQAWYWILGGPGILPTPGQELPPRWQGYRKDSERFPIGLYLSARYERMVMHQEENLDGTGPRLDDNQKLALGTLTFDSFGLAANLWWSRHVRFSANYLLNYLDGDMPLVKDGVKFPQNGPLMQPTYPFYRTAEHELLFRAGLAL